MDILNIGDPIVKSHVVMPAVCGLHSTPEQVLATDADGDFEVERFPPWSSLSKEARIFTSSANEHMWKVNLLASSSTPLKSVGLQVEAGLIFVVA